MDHRTGTSQVSASSNRLPNRNVALISAYTYAWGDDACFPGQIKLADDMGAAERSVRTYLKELESSSLLEIEQRGLGKTNLYKLYLTVKPRTARRS